MLAKKNDPEIALSIARAQREARATGQSERWRPPADEWDTTVEMLATIVDRLGEVEALLADLPMATDKHGKPVKRTKPPKRLARPLTAVEQADELLAEEHVEDIIADVEASYVTAEQYVAMVAEQEAAARYREGGNAG